MSSSAKPNKVNFDEDSMWVSLSDGRVIGVALARFPRLLHARPEERAQVRLSARGLHWESLDEDVSIAALLEGKADQSSPRSTFAA